MPFIRVMVWPRRALGAFPMVCTRAHVPVAADGQHEAASSPRSQLARHTEGVLVELSITVASARALGFAVVRAVGAVAAEHVEAVSVNESAMAVGTWRYHSCGTHLAPGRSRWLLVRNTPPRSKVGDVPKLNCQMSAK